MHNASSDGSVVTGKSVSTGEDAFFVYNGKDVSIADHVSAII